MSKGDRYYWIRYKGEKMLLTEDEMKQVDGGNGIKKLRRATREEVKDYEKNKA